MNILIVNTVLRQLLTMAGTYAVAYGVSANDWTAISGGVLAAVSAAWGILNAEKQTKAVEAVKK